MGSKVSKSMPSSLEASDSDNQIEGAGHTTTLIRTTAIENRDRSNNEGHKSIISWTCSYCGSLSKTNTNICQACFKVRSSVNNDESIWCWEDNNGAYIEYPKSVSYELSNLNIGGIYTMQIEKTTYQIKKTSRTKCEQTNVKTKRKRWVILQNRYRQNVKKYFDDMKTEPGSPTLQPQMQNMSPSPVQKFHSSQTIQSQLESMGFKKGFIRRALAVYEKNYGKNYNIEVLTEIIIRLQKKDDRNKQSKEGDMSQNDDRSKAQIFDADDDSEMKNENKWNSEQLKGWIFSLDMIAVQSRNKIINGIEEYKINSDDFHSCQNGQEIAETFEIENNIGTVIFQQMQNMKSFGKGNYALNVANAKKNIVRDNVGVSWKSKKVCEWSYEDTKDWIHSLEDMISNDDKNRFISGIEASHLSGADFVLCENGTEISDSIDGISAEIGNLVYNELKQLSQVRTLFYSSLSKNKYKIVEITKVCTEKDGIYEQIVRDKCQKLGKRRGSIEKMLWHGSRSLENIKLICENGFDRSYNKKSSFGCGTYFAQKSSYPVTKGFCGKDKSGVSYILLCKVLIGDYIVGNSTMKQIPRKPNGQEYDSLVNNMINPSIFVVWRDYHSVPHYLIKYKSCK